MILQEKKERKRRKRRKSTTSTVCIGRHGGPVPSGAEILFDLDVRRCVVKTVLDMNDPTETLIVLPYGGGLGVRSGNQK